ncbi:MAG: hypothetical protein EOP04_22835 [Proteobacteria bacterium]|nr:MAG: hypothetical protein EOP04_22835 [Pseudomonadota bacterium]
MKKVYLYIFLQLAGIAVMAQSKLEQDRQAIKSLAGFYKVTFNYAETFAPDSFGFAAVAARDDDSYHTLMTTSPSSSHDQVVWY